MAPSGRPETPAHTVKAFKKIASCGMTSMLVRSAVVAVGEQPVLTHWQQPVAAGVNCDMLRCMPSAAEAGAIAVCANSTKQNSKVVQFCLLTASNCRVKGQPLSMMMAIDACGQKPCGPSCGQPTGCAAVQLLCCCASSRAPCTLGFQTQWVYYLC